MAKKASELATIQQSAMAVGGDPTSNLGKENLTPEDLVFPRLAFAQKTSPQIDSSNKSEYIPGLEMFQMFNSVSKKIYGNEVTFAVVRTSKRAMQFAPDGSVIDFNVPLDDPRCRFTDGPNGERIKPVATIFYDYLVAVLPDGVEDTANPEVCMLSLKTTQIKNAKQLNSLISVRPGAIFAGLWRGTTTGKKQGSYSFTNFTVAPAFATPPQMLAVCAEMYRNTEGKTLDTEREVDHADDAAF